MARLAIKVYAQAREYIALYTRAGSTQEVAMCELLAHLADAESGDIQCAVSHLRRWAGYDVMSIAPL